MIDLTRFLEWESGRALVRSEAEELSGVLKALGAPARVRIVSLLAGAPDGIYTRRFLDVMGLSQATLSHHFSVLREAGLINVTKIGADNLNTLNLQRFDELAAALLAVAGAGAKRPKRTRRR